MHSATPATVCSSNLFCVTSERQSNSRPFSQPSFGQVVAGVTDNINDGPVSSRWAGALVLFCMLARSNEVSERFRRPRNRQGRLTCHGFYPGGGPTAAERPPPPCHNPVLAQPDVLEIVLDDHVRDGVEHKLDVAGVSGTANRSFLLRKRMSDVLVNQLLLQMESNRRKLSAMRLCVDVERERKEEEEEDQTESSFQKKMSAGLDEWTDDYISTQKMIAVTPSKQWIHFFLSERCPPTSTILKVSSLKVNLFSTMPVVMSRDRRMSSTVGMNSSAEMRSRSFR
ncbi:hypothetical protein EYF80_018424 [Liparis tanakae]|uniref:Uncharacterized protein n=1 Tax=Liparis tanakae TaxID=230148 RepID=A0A4Z2HZZ2_9TELE|nr:hypothetical protein EYF80_018424 [Liparis tanakae]